MPLLQDGTISTIGDLVKYDSNLLDISNTEGINLTSKLESAKEEISVDLDGLFDQAQRTLWAIAGPARLELRHVVVTPALRLWHTFHTLSLTYRDAYYSQLNDRFQGRWKEYKAQASWARERLLQTGVGIVTDPIVRAEAPTLTATPGPETGGTFYISLSFLNAAGEEGDASTAASITVSDGNLILIEPVHAPENAVGWNVFAGVSPEMMLLQNEEPLGTSDPYYYAASAGPGVMPARTPGTGQSPNFLRALPRLLQRG
jgi:hypothetical protein